MNDQCIQVINVLKYTIDRCIQYTSHGCIKYASCEDTNV